MASFNEIGALRCRNNNFRKYSYRITIVTYVVCSAKWGRGMEASVEYSKKKTRNSNKPEREAISHSLQAI